MCTTDLLSLIEQGFNLTTNIRSDLLTGLEVTEAHWYMYFDIFYAELDSMQSVILLLKSQKYRECVTVLRTIFEYYFLLVLLIKGRRYRHTRCYHIESKPGWTKKKSRGVALTRWKKAWRTKKAGYEKIIDINKGRQDDAIHVTIEDEGLYQQKDVERKGATIPLFYFVFDRYDPYVHYLSDLGSLYGARTIPKDLVEEHKHLYAQFLNIKRIRLNLRLNKLMTQEEEDRFWVHYNFLSCYAHPTKKGLIDPENVIPSWPKTTRYDKAFELLILGYLTQFQSMYIQLLADYFEERNQGLGLSKYENHIVRLQSASKFFWFIYNSPTQSDLEQSELQKKWLQQLRRPIPSGVLYLPNPLDRMRAITGRS